MDVPTTLQQAIVKFSDPEKAFEAAKEFRWPGGNVTCPRCGQAKHSFIKTRRLWFCYVCKKQFTVKVGTVMEDSPLGLDKWMTALWMLANCKNGISSYELAKALGIRQNSAWFMLHRIREAMKDDPSFKFGGEDGGPVESDETFVGPKDSPLLVDFSDCGDRNLPYSRSIRTTSPAARSVISSSVFPTPHTLPSLVLATTPGRRKYGHPPDQFRADPKAVWEELYEARGH
jgi:transposase-like protein